MVYSASPRPKAQRDMGCGVPFVLLQTLRTSRVLICCAEPATEFAGGGATFSGLPSHRESVDLLRLDCPITRSEQFFPSAIHLAPVGARQHRRQDVLELLSL